MIFRCERKINSKKEVWQGAIIRFQERESYYELRIEARSGIMVLFGKCSRGYFACMPDYDCGCHLSDLKDRFWNTEKLTELLGEVDGITVANALYALADKI